MKAFFIIFLLVLAPAAQAATGDVFFIKDTSVYLKSGPGAEGYDIMKLSQDREVVELERQGAWVKVGVAGAHGQDGWLMSSALSPTMINPPPPPPVDKAFEKFKGEVEAFDEDIKKVVVRGLYWDVQDLGEGVAQVVVTNGWLDLKQEERKANLTLLLNMWSSARSGEDFAQVNMVDSRGNLIMTMTDTRPAKQKRH